MVPSLGRFVAICVAMGAVLASVPAAAQWVAVGRWGDPDNFRYVPPGTWMTWAAGADSAEISAEGDNHVGRITLWCRRAPAEGGVRFSHYFGDDLRHPPQEGVVEPVTLVIDGHSIAGQFEFLPQDRIWVEAGGLDSALLDAFAWGTQLELRNEAGQVVTRYRLNNSGAARQALRSRCGI